MLDDLARRRLGKICGMFSSPFDGERATAAAKADALVRNAGLTWEQVITAVHLAEPPAQGAKTATPKAARPPPSPPPPQPDVDWLAAKPADNRPGYWRRLHGLALGVRQTRARRGGCPPSWTANVAGVLLREMDGTPIYYPGANEAMRAAERTAEMSCAA
jgi:hypothetical protein